MSEIKKEIFHDKNIFNLYVEARKYVVSYESIAFSWACGFFLLQMSFFGIFLCHTTGDFSKIPSIIRSEISLGISYTSSILGFLVSGFALFFALLNKEEAKKLVIAPYPIKKNGLGKISCMRMTLYSFMYAFIQYTLFLLFCLIFTLILPEGGPLHHITTYFYKENADAMKILSLMLMSGFSAWFIYIVLLLKSFIWNLYQAILLSIALNSLDN